MIENSLKKRPAAPTTYGPTEINFLLPLPRTPSPEPDGKERKGAGALSVTYDLLLTTYYLLLTTYYLLLTTYYLLPEKQGTESANH